MGCGVSGESQAPHNGHRGDSSPNDGGDADDAASERKRIVIQEWIDSYNHHLHNSLLDMLPSPSTGIGLATTTGGTTAASSSEASRRDNESTLSYSGVTPRAIDEAAAAVQNANRPRMAMMAARMQSSVDSRGMDRCNNTSLPSVAIPSLPASITSRKEAVDMLDHQQSSGMVLTVGPLIGVVATGDSSSSSLQRQPSQRRTMYASGAPQQGTEAPLVDFMGGSSGALHPSRTTPHNVSIGSQAKHSSVVVAGGGLVCASPLNRGDRNEGSPPLESSQVATSEGSGLGNPLLRDLATTGGDVAWNSSGSGTSARRQFPLPTAPTHQQQQRSGGDDVDACGVRKQSSSVPLTVKVPNQHEVLHAVVLNTSGAEPTPLNGGTNSNLGFRVSSTGSTKNVNERFSTRASVATSEGDDNCRGTPHNAGTSLMEYSAEDDSKCFAEVLPSQRDPLSLQLMEQHTADRFTM